MATARGSRARGVFAATRPAGPKPHAGTSEAIDFSILRECSDAGGDGLGFDPRTSPEIIARRLRVSPATVRRHMTLWRATGFLQGYDVLPHPGLLGGRYAARLLEFPNPVAQERAIDALRLIDGVIQIGPARNSLFVAYFVESETQSQRRFAQLRGIADTKEIGPEMYFEFAACPRRMSRSDWRLLLALRRGPEQSLLELARQVGQSVRTTSRRYGSMIDERAMMFDPIFDFSRFHQTLAVLVVTVEPPEARGDVEREIRTLHPASLRSWGPEPPDSGKKTATVSYWVTAPASALLDRLAGRVAHVAGVRDVTLWYGGSTLPVQPWLNERIEAIVRVGHAS
jgi:DNA-binding Lrp family transcriptional regulator